jgi:hypothetical protein
VARRCNETLPKQEGVDSGVFRVDAPLGSGYRMDGDDRGWPRVAGTDERGSIMVNDTEVMVLRYGMERQRKTDERLWQMEDLRDMRRAARRERRARRFQTIQTGAGAVLASVRRLTGRPAIPVNECP